jgi:hypothetical protein
MKVLVRTISLPRDVLKIIATLLAIATIGLSVVGNYGITWDEPIEVDMVQQTFDYIYLDRPVPEMSRHYGFYFNYLSQVIYDKKQEFFPDPPLNIPEKDYIEQWLVRSWRVTRVKHVLTFLFSLLGYLAVIGIVAILAGKEFAWLGALILALFPTYWGHSFFNPKDIPFATMFTVGTFCGTLLLQVYCRSSPVRIGLNLATLYTALYGMVVGLVTGIRIGGFFLLFYVFFTHLLVRGQKKSPLAIVQQFLPFYLLMAVFWALTSYALYPTSWRNPIAWFIEAITLMSKYNIWDHTVLFDGQQIPGRSLPWYYLPRLLNITTPTIFQIFFVIGGIWFLKRLPRLTPTQQAAGILCLLQFFFLPSLVILRQSTLYDGLRHFLFIIPPMAAIATTAMIWTYHKITKKSSKIFAVVLLLVSLSPIVVDAIALHPYEYTYYNRLYGGLPATRGQQETDYWGLSLTEGMAWVNQNVPAGSTLVITHPMFAAEMTRDRSKNFRLINRDNFQVGKTPDPDYYMAISRYDYFDAFPHCPIVHTVSRQNTPLTIIKQCRKP